MLSHYPQTEFSHEQNFPSEGPLISEDKIMFNKMTQTPPDIYPSNVREWHYFPGEEQNPFLDKLLLGHFHILVHVLS